MLMIERTFDAYESFNQLIVTVEIDNSNIFNNEIDNSGDDSEVIYIYNFFSSDNMLMENSTFDHSYINLNTASLRKLNCCSETEVAAMLQAARSLTCDTINHLSVDNVPVAYPVRFQLTSWTGYSRSNTELQHQVKGTTQAQTRHLIRYVMIMNNHFPLIFALRNVFALLLT